MNSEPLKRAYRQTARAAAAEATGERILDVFARRLQADWFDEIRLEDVAREAGVTVQTVIRRFGGKEGLLQAAQERAGREIRGRRNVAPGDVRTAVRLLTEDYEAAGDLTIRLLSQEDRYPALRTMTDVGRAGHRGWLRQTFAPWLDRLPPAEAERRLDALVVATDVYVWKLVRRDMGRPAAELESLILRLVASALEGLGPNPVNPADPETRHDR